MRRFYPFNQMQALFNIVLIVSPISDRIHFNRIFAAEKRLNSGT